jgi:hypothetical protein
MALDPWRVIEASLTPLQKKTVKWLAKNAPNEPYAAGRAGIATISAINRWGSDHTRGWVAAYRKEFPCPEEVAEEARNRLLRMVPAAVTLIGEAITGTAKPGRVNQFSVRLAQFAVETAFARADALKKERLAAADSEEAIESEELDNILDMAG